MPAPAAAERRPEAVAKPGPSARVASSGLLTAAGDDAASVEAAVRAGICRYRDSAVCDGMGEQVRLALAPDEALHPVPPRVRRASRLTARQARMIGLAVPALRNAAAGTRTKPMPLLLAAPAPYEERGLPFGAAHLALLAELAQVPIDAARSAVLSGGRAEGFAAIARGLEILARGAPAVLVGGVDSCFDLHLLGTLQRERRLLGPEAGDGFVPGEAAAFLLLTSQDSAGQRLHMPGIGDEPGHRGSSEPCRGDGLTQAVERALRPFPAVGTVITGFTGEQLPAKEWSIAAMRLRSALAVDIRVFHPFATIGDLGAASAAVMVACAAAGLARGALAGPCLAWAASDGSPRGAICIS